MTANSETLEAMRREQVLMLNDPAILEWAVVAHRIHVGGNERTSAEFDIGSKAPYVIAVESLGDLVSTWLNYSNGDYACWTVDIYSRGHASYAEAERARKRWLKDHAS